MVESGFKVDRYGAIDIADMSQLPETEEQFETSLT
jgi:hypothetical protein